MFKNKNILSIRTETEIIINASSKENQQGFFK